MAGRARSWNHRRGAPMSLAVAASFVSWASAVVAVSETPDGPRKASVGIFYGTRRGRTETAARHLEAATGLEATDIQADGPFTEDFHDYDSIMVGTPTYNTGAAVDRSQTNWDDWLYEVLPDIAISGKKVAVFCTGEQERYHKNYCDAAGELYDKFKEAGYNMMGSTSTDGYSHSASKAERDGQFIGQMFDEKSQKDLSEGRAKAWVEQLHVEGFFEAPFFEAPLAANASTEASHGMEASHASTGADDHSTEKANPVEALDSGSLLILGAVVAVSACLLIHNFLGSKRETYVEVQGAANQIM